MLAWHNLSHIFPTPPQPSPRQYVHHIYIWTQVSWLTSGDAGCIADISWHTRCFTAVFQLLPIWPFLPILQDSGYAEEHDRFLWHGPSCCGVNSTEWKQDHMVCYSRQHGPDSIPVVVYEIQGVCYIAVALFRILRSVDKFPYVIYFKLTLYLESLVKGPALWSVLLLSSLWQTILIADSSDFVKMKCADFWRCICCLTYCRLWTPSDCTLQIQVYINIHSPTQHFALQSYSTWRTSFGHECGP